MRVQVCYCKQCQAVAKMLEELRKKREEESMDAASQPTKENKS